MIPFPLAPQGAGPAPYPSRPSPAQPGRLYEAGDQAGLAALGLRTWAAAGAGPAAQAQIRGAAAAFFREGDHVRPDPPAYSRLSQLQVPATVVIGDREYPMVARCGEEVAARIPGSRLIPAPGADHLLPLRVPGLIARLAGELAGQAG